MGFWLNHSQGLKDSLILTVAFGGWRSSHKSRFHMLIMMIIHTDSMCFSFDCWLGSSGGFGDFKLHINTLI